MAHTALICDRALEVFRTCLLFTAGNRSAVMKHKQTSEQQSADVWHSAVSHTHGSVQLRCGDFVSTWGGSARRAAELLYRIKRSETENFTKRKNTDLLFLTPLLIFTGGDCWSEADISQITAALSTLLDIYNIFCFKLSCGNQTKVMLLF